MDRTDHLLRAITNCTFDLSVSFQQATTTMADQAAAIVEIMVNTTIINLETIKINTKALGTGLCLAAPLIHLSIECVVVPMCLLARDCPKPLLKFMKIL